MTDTARIDALADAIGAELRVRADPGRAAGQQAYMKSAMPFLGVRMPDARAAAASVARGVDDADVLLALAAVLWSRAEFREERYAAMAVLAHRGLRGDARLVPLVERMVREGRWWDITDELAHRLAELHDRDPVATGLLVRTWSGDEETWIRRIAIISQLGRRDRVDADLLAAVIVENAGDPDFFIRKAIGWMLREYARVRPDWVRAFVAEVPLSALSSREALKRL